MNLQVVTQLADFMVERQEIWFKKEILKQPYPWTEDDRLKKGFFTNVYRDEDKTTKAVFKVLDTLKEPYLILYNIFCMNFFILFEFHQDMPFMILNTFFTYFSLIPT